MDRDLRVVLITLGIITILTAAVLAYAGVIPPAFAVIPMVLGAVFAIVQGMALEDDDNQES